MINDLPTIFEVVTGTAKNQAKEKSSVSNHTGNKSKSGSKGVKPITSFSLVFFFLLKLFFFGGRRAKNCFIR